MDDIREYLSMLRRRWEIPVWCTTICLGVAVFIAYTTPPTYRSSGTIMIESAEIPLNPQEAGGAGNRIDQHLELVRRRVLSDESLKALVEEHGLFPDREPDRRASAVMRNVQLEQIDPITMEPLIGGTAFHVHFTYPEAQKARDVANDLVDLFLADNRRARMQSASETQTFFATQATRLAGEIRDVEGKIAQFKRENRGLLPEDIRNNEAALERAERELTALQSEIRVVTERRNLLMVQRDALYRDSELATLKSELAVMRQRYSDEHPTIKRLERSIAALEETGSGVTQDDPELRQVSAQLQATEQELQAFRDREQRIRDEIAALSERLVLAPSVEKELQELNREYEMLNGEYREMRQRQGDAEIASNLEEEDKGERYTEMQEPRLPGAPYSPNRLGIFLLGVMVSLGGSAGLVALREGADESVRSPRDILAAIDAPPMATIPVIRNEADKWLRYRRLAAHGAAWFIFTSVTFGAVLYG